jgi:D-lactate dehydrogenase
LRHELRFFEPHLNKETVGLAAGFEAVCIFVNDQANAAVIETLSSLGVRLIALRCAGYNNVDLTGATQYGITVVRVPAYSPYAVAEHTIALMLALNRKLYRAYNRVREGNFALDGLLGFDMRRKTAGVIGTISRSRRWPADVLYDCRCSHDPVGCLPGLRYSTPKDWP